MTKGLPVSFRLEPEEKAALDRAAAADDRSASSWLSRLVRRELQATGFLPAASKPGEE